MFDRSDLKYNAQVKADELALEQYGQEFYDLPDQQQYDLYSKAYQLEVERLVGAAERAAERIEDAKQTWKHRQ